MSLTRACYRGAAAATRFSKDPRFKVLGIRGFSVPAGQGTAAGPVLGASWEGSGFEVSAINGAPKIPSPWNKWFPHEPIPFSPKLGPYAVKVTAGERYVWCSCGQCRTQPWSEGECQAPFHGIPYEARHTGTVWLCGSKHSGSKPEFNGTCWLVWCDINPIPAAALGFMASFVVGVVLTWIVHP
jgi:hypothetical protein